MFVLGIYFVLFLHGNFAQDIGNTIGINCEIPDEKQSWVLTKCIEEIGFFDEPCFVADVRCSEKCIGRCLVDDFSETMYPCTLRYR